MADTHQEQHTPLFWMEKNHYGPPNQQTRRPPTSPTFLTRIHQSIKNGIVIPKQFSDSFLCKCTSAVKLLGPTGQICTVKVKMLHDTMVIRGRQWRNFAEYYELETGDNILFTFIGSGTFQVRMFHLSFEQKQSIHLLTADMNDNVMRNVHADRLQTTINSQLHSTEMETLRSPLQRDERSSIAVDCNTDKSIANVNGKLDKGSMRSNVNCDKGLLQFNGNCDKGSIRNNGNCEKSSVKIIGNCNNFLAEVHADQVKNIQDFPAVKNASDGDCPNNVNLDSLPVNDSTGAGNRGKNRMHYLMLSDSDASETEEEELLSESKEKEVDFDTEDLNERTSSDRQSIVDKANEFTSEFPVVRKELTPSYCNKMIFPKPFVTEYMPAKDLTIKILDPQGREWKCSWLGHDRRLQNKHYTPCISKGWREFTKANALKSHDIVVFELIDQKKFRFRVHFYRS